MKRYNGTQIVDEGIYLDIKALRFTAIDERGPLPGEAHTRYAAIPTLLVLPLAAIISLAYVIFLPLVGFVMVGGAVVRSVVHVGTQAGAVLLRVRRHA